MRTNKRQLLRLMICSDDNIYF